MAFNQNHIGFNLSSNKLQIVEIIHDDENFILENVDEEYFDEFLSLEFKEIQFISILQNAFNELQLRKPISGREISIALPNQFFNILEIPYEASLTKKDLSEFFKWNLSILYPYEKPEDFVIQHIEREGKKNSIIVLSILRKYLVALHKFSTRNNLFLKYVDNVHIASNALFVHEDTLTKHPNIILSIYTSEKNVSFNILKEGCPIYFTSCKTENITDVVAITAKEILKIHATGISKNSIERSFISGEKVSDSLLKQIQEACDLPVIRYNPFNRIKANADMLSNKFYSESYNSFTAAMGMALRV